jgi:neutral ceramidase
MKRVPASIGMLGALLFCAQALQPAWSAAPAPAPASASASSLRAGAARVDYTPEAGALPRNFRGVLDPIYVRMVVLEDEGTRAALVTIDAGAIPTPLFQKVSVWARQELGIAPENLLISATHTHSVPFRLGDEVEEKIMQGLRESVARLQPARVAYGTGASHINVNRDRIDPKTGRWWERPNYEGASDKTVAVVRFETLQGAPIAVYANYAVHAVLTGTLDLVSGDIPGATSRYVESALGGDAVVLWARIPSTSTRPTSCEKCALRTTPVAARTSAMRCRREGRAWTWRIPGSAC